MSLQATPGFILTIPYRLELLPLVTSFVSESAKSLGASEQEAFRLSLAAEEVFAYIMEAFPAAEKDALFYLRCEEADDKVSYSFSNHGKPLNVRATPQFDASDIESTIDGLGLSLAGQLTDSLDFINCGNDGWLIVFSKQLANFTPLSRQSEVSIEKNGDSQVNIGLHVTRATTQHVPQLIDLIYRTYRYSYFFNALYDETNFSRDISEKKRIVLLAETGDKKIIGCGIIHFATPHFAELGSLMTDPAYRNSSAVALLIKETSRLFRDPAFKDTLFYSYFVTTHTYSQRLIDVLKMAPLSLRLSINEPFKFIGIKEEREQRESYIFAVLRTPLTGRNLTLHVPSEHSAIIAQLLHGVGIFADLKSETSVGQSACTLFSKTPLGNTQAMLMQVDAFGPDFAALLQQETRTLQQDGFLTCILTLPLAAALPPETDRILKNNKYFFSGLDLKADGSWHMVYTNLFHQRFQFAALKLHGAMAQELLAYLEKEYLSLYQ